MLTILAILTSALRVRGPRGFAKPPALALTAVLTLSLPPVLAEQAPEANDMQVLPALAQDEGQGSCAEVEDAGYQPSAEDGLAETQVQPVAGEEPSPIVAGAAGEEAGEESNEQASEPPPEEVPAPRESNESRAFRPITSVTVDVSLPAGLLPGDDAESSTDPTAGIPESGDGRLAGAWASSQFPWEATALCHRPLYFEQANLERYGYGVHPLLQPAASSAHFFLSIPALPYKMVVDRPRDCIYTLGHYRPGSRVPWRRNLPPWQAGAAGFEAATAVGLVFLIP